MFNFKVFSQGLVDIELSDKAFRLLSLLLNNLSLQNVDEIETYNQYVMKTLGWSRSTVKRMMNELVSKGYIIKEAGGNKGNKKPNRIKVSVKPDTDFEKVRFTDEPDFESEVQNRPKVRSKSEPLYKSTEDNVTCTCTEMKEETTKRLTRDEVAKRNDFITSVYKKLDDDLDYLFTVKTKITYDGMCEKINRIFQEANDNDEWFTDAQWAKLQRYADRFIKICDGKDNYFSNAPTPGPVTYDENAECSVDELWE